MSPIWETVSGILVSVGGAGAIMCGIVKFAANRIADQLTIKYKNELDKEILKIKADLENDSHSYQAKFDKEFNLYGKLMASFFEMVKTVYWLFPYGIDYPPTDKNEKKVLYEERYNKAYESLKLAQQNLAANSVFIPEDIYKKFSYVLSLSRTQYNMFPHFSSLVDLDGSIANMRSECFKRSNDIQDEFDSLIVYLREYIANQLK